jgi:hypothetical protein
VTGTATPHLVWVFHICGQERRVHIQGVPHVFNDKHMLSILSPPLRQHMWPHTDRRPKQLLRDVKLPHVFGGESLLPTRCE